MFSTGTILISVGVTILLTIIAISIFIIYKKRRNSIHVQDFVEIDIFKSSFSGITDDHKIFNDNKTEVIPSETNQQSINKLTFSKLNQLSVKRTNSLRTQKQQEIEISIIGVNNIPQTNKKLILGCNSNPKTKVQDITSKQISIHGDVHSNFFKKKEYIFPSRNMNKIAS